MRARKKHVNFTALSPIEYRPNDPDGRIHDIKVELEHENAKDVEDQILSRCPMVHMARLQVIDDILPAMGTRHGDSLKSKYLLFQAQVSGDSDDFLDGLYNGPQQVFSWEDWDSVGQEHSRYVHSLWGRCLGYPNRTGAVFFRQYMKRCRIGIALPYAAYDHTVQDIKDFNSRKEEFVKFVTRTQGMKAPELHSEWRKYAQPAAGADDEVES